MKPKTKDDLLNWLAAVQNNFMVGMAAVSLFENEAAWPLLEGANIAYHPAGTEADVQNASYVLPVYYVGRAMQNPEVRPKLLLDFRQYLLRNALAEALELTREYCVATRQEDGLERSDWYHFARLLRNAETHDGVLRFDRRARPPIVFQKWRLDASDEGKALHELKLIPSTTTIPILEASQEFVKAVLK